MALGQRARDAGKHGSGRLSMRSWRPAQGRELIDCCALRGRRWIPVGASTGRCGPMASGSAWPSAGWPASAQARRGWMRRSLHACPAERKARLSEL